MQFSHDEMMLIIQGLRLVNGIDQFGKEYNSNLDDQIKAMELLKRIDGE